MIPHYVYEYYGYKVRGLYLWEDLHDRCLFQLDAIKIWRYSMEVSFVCEAVASDNNRIMVQKSNKFERYKREMCIIREVPVTDLPLYIGMKYIRSKFTELLKGM